MPVDLSIPNAIFGTYLKAKALKQQRIKDEADTQTRNDQLAEMKKEHEAALSQANTHFNAKLAMDKAEHAMKMAAEGQKIQDVYGMGGGAPGAVEETPMSTGAQDTALMGQTFHNSIDPFSGQTQRTVSSQAGAPLRRMLTIPGVPDPIALPDPYAYQHNKADTMRLMNQPAIERAIAIAGGQEDAKVPGLMRLKQAEIEARMQQDEANKLALRQQAESVANIHAGSARDVANIMANSRHDVANINADARINAAGKKTMPAGLESKIRTMETLRDNLNNLIVMGDNSNWDEHTPLVGGMMGAIKNRMGKGTEAGRSYRTALGKYNSEETHRLYGSVLSKGELEQRKTFTPDLSEAGTTARSKLISQRQFMNDAIARQRGWQTKTIVPTVGKRAGQEVHMFSDDGGVRWSPMPGE